MDYKKQQIKNHFINFYKDIAITPSENNLCSEIREQAIEYFNANKISFWHHKDLDKTTKENTPSGVSISSQIACLNHLFYIRNRQDIATAILRNIDIAVKSALKVDNGFVEFEIIGKDNYLNEKYHKRGTKSTSIDAVMLAEMNNGAKKIFAIEWKYTEQYIESYDNEKIQSKYKRVDGQERKNRYLPLLENTNSPLNVTIPISEKIIEGIFFEPFDQLFRQTLLVDQMVKAHEYEATDYLHVHVIPQGNLKLLNENPAKEFLPGKTLHETWINLLKLPEKYKVIDPKNFVSVAQDLPETEKWLNYLSMRYWK